MADKFNKLNETFDIEPDNSETSKIEKIEQISSTVEDIKKDYEYTRGNLYSIIEKGQEAIDSVLELAQETEQPRAYEVLGQLIKNVSDTTDKLMELQKKLKDVEEESGKTKGPSTVNNALFVGSTAELSKLLKNGLKDLDK